MRFVTLLTETGPRAGMLSPGCGRILDLGHPCAAEALDGTPPDLLAMIQRGLGRVAARLADVDPPTDAWREAGGVTLLAPLPRPPRLIGAAFNYRDGLAERGAPIPDAPTIFLKTPDTVVGPGATVRLPRGIGGITWEAELAAVIGSADAALPPLERVAGYCVINDVSASELIRAEGSFARGKNFPTFAPLGPVLATPDELADPQALRVRFTLNGTVMQESTTAQMVFGIAELITRLEALHRLQPGDVIATGTPAGVAPAHKPPRWLTGGDVMAAEVEGLGRLENPVAWEDENG